MALIIGATLLPFGGMPAERIPPAWCIKCGALWLTDAIANVALFVPFGLALAWRTLHPIKVAAASFALSAFVEGMQSLGYPPGRSAAIADLITNTAGGVLGAGMLALLHTERTRTSRGATWLAAGWLAMSLGVFVLTARALQPYRHAAADTPQRWSKSPFRHVPGHGWYEGITDSAAIGDTLVRRGWSGPIILSASVDRLPVEASVWVRSTDPLGGQIPLLFVHLEGDSAAWLQIAKQGDDAELTVMRTAWKWGLALPSVVVRDAFRGRGVRDSSTLAIHARVSGASLALQAGSKSDSLRLTPLLGWSLIQPVVSVQSRLARFAEWCWVLFCLAPVTWWARRSSRPALSMALTVLVSCGGLALLPGMFALAPLGLGEWGAVLATLALGALRAPPAPVAASGV